MFRIHDPDKTLPLVLTEMNWPRQEEESDPLGPECPVLAVADPKEPDNRDMMVPLLALTENGVDFNPSASEELSLAGYGVPDSMFSDGRLRMKDENDEIAQAV